MVVRTVTETFSSMANLGQRLEATYPHPFGQPDSTRTTYVIPAEVEGRDGVVVG